MQPLKSDEFLEFRKYIKRICAISISEEKRYLLESRLKDLGSALHAETYSDLLLKIQMDRRLQADVIDRMSTNETLWFRDLSCWNTLEKELLPKLLEKLSQGKPSIRIWSAACSTGQEPYSLMILIDEILEKRMHQNLRSKVQILATDINHQVLLTAKEGRYDSFMMKRGISEDRKKRHFEQSDNDWTISPELKKQIRFQPFNLMEAFDSHGEFDLILCRNVLIYFSVEFKTELYQKFHNALKPDGALLLGSTENILPDLNPFQKKRIASGFYYAKNDPE